MCDWNSGSWPRSTRSREIATSGRMYPSSLSFGQWSVCRAMWMGYLAATTCANSASAVAPTTMSLTEPDRYSAPPVETCTIPSLPASANPLQRGVQRLARGDVDRGVGEAPLLGRIKHLGVDLGGRDRHDADSLELLC